MRYQPIRYRTIREVLDWTRTFHQILSKEYESLSQGPVTERVKMQLEYLANHEKVLQLTIQHFEEDAQKCVLDTWHDHFPELDLPDDLEELRGHLETASTEEVLRAALHFHDALICLFEEIRNTASTDEVRDAFDNLVLMENRERERISRDSAMLQDF